MASIIGDARVMPENTYGDPHGPPYVFCADSVTQRYASIGVNPMISTPAPRATSIASTTS